MIALLEEGYTCICIVATETFGFLSVFCFVFYSSLIVQKKEQRDAEGFAPRTFKIPVVAFPTGWPTH